MPRNRLRCAAIAFLVATSALAESPIAGRVTQLLADGQTVEAHHLIKSALAAHPSDSHLLTLRGEVLFRQSQFESAADAWNAALAINPDTARAHWGLGRIDQMQFHRRSARDHFARAYQLDYRDPDILIDYAGYVQNDAVRKRVFQNVLTLNGHHNPRLIEEVRARLAIEEHLGERALATLASPYQSYRLKLETFFGRDGRPSGLTLKASLNGGKPLRLMIDTGADGIVVNRNSVRTAALEPLVDSALEGLGKGSATKATLTLAESVSFGDLRWTNRFVQVIDANFLPGADGVIGTNVFQEFLVRIDARSGTLDLSPFDQRPAPLRHLTDSWMTYNGEFCSTCNGFVPAFRVGHLLLIRTTRDNGNDGLFLIDSGSAYSVVAANHDDWSPQSAPDLRSVTGEVPIVARIALIKLDIGNARLIDPTPMAVDLGQFSQQKRIEISGLIGYSLIRGSILTLNYRDGAVRFETDTNSQVARGPRR